MDSLRRDLRFVARALVRSPGFSLVTILTLALGIGGTTAIFSVVHGVLLRGLPYPGAERIQQLAQLGPSGAKNDLSDPNFADLQAQSRSFAAMAQWSGGGTVSVTGGCPPQGGGCEAVRAAAADVSREFFDVMGVRPRLGRAFAAEEQRVGGTPAVIVSHTFWQRTLGGAPIAGKTLTFSGRVHNVVGVMPPAFDYPTGVSLWVPRELAPPTPSRTAHNSRAVVRLEAGVSLAQARREVSAVARRLKAQLGEDTRMADAALTPLRDQLVGHVRPALLVLLGASAVLLLIACANVTNLLLARAAARRGELAVRLALGAGRRGLVQQFLVEALVLSLAGSALGVLLASAGVRALLALEPGNLPRAGEVGVSGAVLAFALGVSVLTAVGIGLVTALRGTAGDIRETLAQGSRSRGAGASQRVRGALVVAQVAMTVVLLVGAGLLGRSFLRLLTIDPGYRTGGAVVLDVSLPWTDDEAALRRTVALYDALLARVRALPGVVAAGGVNDFPLRGGGYPNGTFLVMRHAAEPLDLSRIEQIMQDTARTGSAEFRVATDGYFAAMGIPLQRGRMFDARDDAAAPHVALVSASLAAQRWPTEDPIGKVVQFGNMDGDLRPFTVIGVVGDIREASLAAEPRPTFYAFYRQRPRRASDFNLVIQGGDAAAVTAAAQRAVRELAPEVPPRVRTLAAVVAGSLADRRFNLLLLGVFGGAALLLAMLGIYAVISYLVTQRRQEIGVRVALGAQSADVLRFVVGQGARLTLLGVAVGTVAALALTRLLARLLFGVSTTDPVAFGAVIALLSAVALLASYIPARRAAKVEPMEVLRGA